MDARLLPALALMLALQACGEGMPQSDAARRAGDVPKQTIDGAAKNVSEALQQGAERNRQGD